MKKSDATNKPHQAVQKDAKHPKPSKIGKGTSESAGKKSENTEETPDLNHEVKHETMPPYVSGDYDNLS